jgi:cysteine dioxygenase
MRGREALLDLCRRWDGRGGAISLGELSDELGRLDVTRDDLRGMIAFHECHYQRVAIRRSPHYELLVLCWRSGQRTAIHDHEGSACAVRVVEGRVTETRFGPSPCGLLSPIRSSMISAGSVTGCQDEGTHQMANLEPPGHDLITLHAYSPPPLRWRYYAIGETVFANHDQLLAERPGTLIFDIGHAVPSAPRSRKTRGGIPWTR